MADFAEEIKGLIRHDNNTDDEPDEKRTKIDDHESSNASEINGNYKEDGNTCDSQDSQNSADNNTENTEEGPSSQEQDGLTEVSSEAEPDDNKQQSNGVRVLNIVPLSESEESNIDIGDGCAGVACS